ncbi:uncharacterized protein LOC135289047 [Passer domesticus]|uniref:uncharacterized protein LOC135289047 n=1 Tax=Passer domesticus TaxID=48849 RepID=UPI0030FF2EC0
MPPTMMGRDRAPTNAPPPAASTACACPAGCSGSETGESVPPRDGPESEADQPPPSEAESCSSSPHREAEEASASLKSSDSLSSPSETDRSFREPAELQDSDPHTARATSCNVCHINFTLAGPPAIISCTRWSFTQDHAASENVSNYIYRPFVDRRTDEDAGTPQRPCSPLVSGHLLFPRRGSSRHVCISASLTPPSEAAFRCSTSRLAPPAGPTLPPLQRAGDQLFHGRQELLPPPLLPLALHSSEGGTASVIGRRNSRTDCSVSFPVISYGACADVLATPCAIVSACRRAFVPANVASPAGSPPFFHGACADGSDSGTGSVSPIAGDSAAAQLPAAAQPASASAAGTPAVAAPAADGPASGLATSPSVPQPTVGSSISEPPANPSPPAACRLSSPSTGWEQRQR